MAGYTAFTKKALLYHPFTKGAPFFVHFDEF